jgi:hypothetical protein
MATKPSDSDAQFNSIAEAQSQWTALQGKVSKQAQAQLTLLANAFTQAGKAAHATPEIRTRAARYQALASALSSSRSASSVPQSSADSFILHGTVVSGAGKPLANMSVALSDDKGILNARLPPVKTDANGSFTFTVRKAEYPDLTPGTAQIFVSVTDAQQKEVAKPSQALVFQPGKVAIMPIAT